MKVKSLLSKAAKCTTQADADKLLETILRVFGRAKQVSHLFLCNTDASMEDDKAFVHFELNQKISEHFITMIRPEIRDGKFVVVVLTNHMLDGRGMSSQSWEIVEDMEDVIESSNDEDRVATLVQRAKEQAIANHARLIERVGVSRPLALEVAGKSWKEPAVQS